MYPEKCLVGRRERILTLNQLNPIMKKEFNEPYLGTSYDAFLLSKLSGLDHRHFSIDPSVRIEEQDPPVFGDNTNDNTQSIAGHVLLHAMLQEEPELREFFRLDSFSGRFSQISLGTNSAWFMDTIDSFIVSIRVLPHRRNSYACKILKDRANKALDELHRESQ